MARQTEKSAQERVDEIFASVERQMRGAANAAKRFGAPATEASVNDREAVVALLEPIWADITAGLKGVKVAQNGSAPSLTERLKPAAKKGK